MFNMLPEPVTSLQIVIRLTEAKARTILVDPAPFQKQLRQALADTHRGAHSERRPSHLGKNGSARPKASGGKGHFPCQHCKRKFAYQGFLNKHLEREHRVTAPAAA